MSTIHTTAFQDVFYIPNLEHRNNNPNKSQWSISELEERNCFDYAAKLKYERICELRFSCWGIHLDNGKMCYLGKSKNSSSEPPRKLFMAKFVDSDKNHKWHGYPADYEMNVQDIPPVCVLEIWRSSGYLTTPKVRKIIKGQRCRL